MFLELNWFDVPGRCPESHQPNGKTPRVQKCNERTGGCPILAPASVGDECSAPNPAALIPWIVAFCLAGGLVARADERDVTVVGGPDATGQNYEWTITNQDRSSIVEVRIPHYRATLFHAPLGWKTDASTYLVNVGVADRPGECIARAPSELEGIVPGKSGLFRLQITPGGARRGVGSVTVRFADGRETAIARVAVPQPELVGDRYVSVIGLALIFGVVIGVQMRRRRHSKRRSQS